MRLLLTKGPIMRHVGLRDVSSWCWSLWLPMRASFTMILAVIARYLALHAALLSVQNIVAIGPATVMPSVVSKTLVRSPVRVPIRAPVSTLVAVKVPM